MSSWSHTDKLLDKILTQQERQALALRDIADALMAYIPEPPSEETLAAVRAIEIRQCGANCTQRVDCNRCA